MPDIRHHGNVLPNEKEHDMTLFTKFTSLAAIMMMVLGCSLATGDNLPGRKVSLAIHNVTIIDPETETV